MNSHDVQRLDLAPSPFPSALQRIPRERKCCPASTIQRKLGLPVVGLHGAIETAATAKEGALGASPEVCLVRAVQETWQAKLNNKSHHNVQRAGYIIHTLFRIFLYERVAPTGRP